MLSVPVTKGTHTCSSSCCPCLILEAALFRSSPYMSLSFISQAHYLDKVVKGMAFLLFFLPPFLLSFPPSHPSIPSFIQQMHSSLCISAFRQAPTSSSHPSAPFLCFLLLFRSFCMSLSIISLFVHLRSLSSSDDINKCL